MIINVTHNINVTIDPDCMLNVQGKMKTTPGRHFEYSDDGKWYSYYMAALIPILDVSRSIHNFTFGREPALEFGIKRFIVSYGKTTNVYGTMVSHTQSSWMKANEDCKSRGGSMFTLDSFEQWHILVDNMAHLFQENHYEFWSSLLIFLGHPKVQRVSSFCLLFLNIKMCLNLQIVLFFILLLI